MKPVIPVGIFEMMIVLNDNIAFILARYTFKFTEHIWTEIRNEHSYIKL